MVKLQFINEKIKNINFKMETIIDEYINNYNLLPFGKNLFECEIGSLGFFKDNSNDIIIFEIFINIENRRKGFCKNLINHLINKCKENKCKLLIVSVISKPLYNFLYSFKNDEGRFLLNKRGFHFHYFTNSKKNKIKS